MIVALRDKDGNVVAEVDSRVFPLEFPVETVFGEKTYQVSIAYKRDDSTRKRDFTKPTGAWMNAKQ